MFHCYVFYPFILRVLSSGKKDNEITFVPNGEQLPNVFVVFSVFNEEKVIREKLESIFNATYPLHKLKVYLGSDNSTDNTNNIISEYVLKYPQLIFVPYAERNGKPKVLDKLVNRINESNQIRSKDVFVFTDANVIFTTSTITELVKHFKNESIGLVAANIISKAVQQDGISLQEKTYTRGETAIKHWEGLIWGTMIGAFGGCYAMRADCWVDIPDNYIVDDFYLSMNVLAQGKKAISEMNAKCIEDVSNDVEQEFNRKARIQTGNLQNLSTYWKLLFRFNAVSFCFFSHKIIRWMGPLFIALAYATNAWLLSMGPFYYFTFLLQNILLVSPVIDAIFKRAGIHWMPLRFISYFYMMNLALLNGFIIYLTGVKSSTWTPTKRNV